MTNYLKRFDEVPELTTDALGTVVPFSKGFEDVIPTLLEGGRIKTIETNYNRRKFGKPHFGKIKDILLTIFDIIKFRIYSFYLILRK